MRLQFNTKFALGALVLLAVAGGALSMGMFNRQERVIRRNMETLCRLVDLKEKPNVMDTARRALALENYLAPDVHVDSAYAPFKVDNRHDLVAAFSLVRSQSQFIRVKMSGLEINLDPPQRSAVVTGTFQIEVGANGASDSDRTDAEVLWRRDDDGWRIARIRTVEPMVRPADF